MKKAKQLRKGFTPRAGFDPSELHHATTARVWYSPEVARWEVEKGAAPLVDGSAVSERSVGSADWLVGEVLSFRGGGGLPAAGPLRELVPGPGPGRQRPLR